MSESVAAVAAPVEVSSSPEVIESQATEALEQAASELKGVAGEVSKEKAPASAKEALKQEAKKYKLKVDGEESEVSEEELVKHAQMGKAAQKRMQEAAEYKKSVDQLIDLMRKDPLAVLSDPALGVDIEKIFADYANKKIEDSQKTPEQKEREALQKELEDLRKEKLNAEEARKKAELDSYQQAEAQKIQEEIIGALDAHELPKKPYYIKRMADYMLLALNKGIDLSPKDIVPVMKREMDEEIRDMISSAPEDMVEELIGKEFLSKMRKRSVAKMKAAAPSPTQVKSTGQGGDKKEEPSKKITLKQFLRDA